jgi:tetratricopeptide (TPR) repeat protein
VDHLLREGIAAAKSGQRERARDLLMRVVEQDEESVLAWLWLSGVVDSLDDQEICLESVLTLDPGNDAARKGLAWVREQKEAQTSPAEHPSAASARAAKPISLAAAVLREDFARRRPPPEPMPELPSTPLRDEFEGEYQCPYCAAQTHPDDRKCKACGHELWIKVRRREERSSWLWVALTLQMASTIWPATVSLLTLFYVAYRIEVDNPFTLAPVYLGLPGNVPPEVASAAFELVPPSYALPFAFHLLFSLIVLVGLYLRWKPIFYLFLISALLTLGSAIASIAIGLGPATEGVAISQGIGLTCGGGGVILSLLMFLLVLQIEDDFFFEEKRMLLRVDRDATNGPALLNSGHHYAKRNMWAMAAIHLRRAAGMMPHEIDCHQALTVVYINLKRYDLAAKALEEARRINSDDPQVKKLAALLSSQPAAESAPHH